MICRICNEEKGVEEFNWRNKSKGWKQSSCKSCEKKWREDNREILLRKKKEYYQDNKESHNSYHRQKYQKNKEKYTKQTRDFYKDNREKYLLNKSRERAKKDSLEHTISLSDIVIPEYCPVLGIKLTTDLGMGQLETNASLDRIDSSKGYVPGNVQVISRKANTMKSNATYKELKKFGEWCAKL